MHASNGEYDVYVAKLNSSGDFQWARTWGGSQDDSGDCVTLDDSGNVYCTGSSNGTVDFDPGPGVDEHSTGGAFLSKLDSQGDFEWARTFGNPTFMYSYGVALNGGGNPAVCGLYRGPADFDPGADFDIHVTPPHSSGIFVSMYGSNGDYIWTQTWVAEQSYSGGSCDDIKCDIKGNLIVTGYLPNYGLDLDPGPGVNAVERGVFVMKLLPNGYW
jgi:hypothetical protein